MYFFIIYISALSFAKGTARSADIICACILGGPALRALDDYTEQRDAGKNPEFKASKIGLTQKLDYWQD